MMFGSPVGGLRVCAPAVSFSLCTPNVSFAFQKASCPYPKTWETYMFATWMTFQQEFSWIRFEKQPLSLSSDWQRQQISLYRRWWLCEVSSCPLGMRRSCFLLIFGILKRASWMHADLGSDVAEAWRKHRPSLHMRYILRLLIKWEPKKERKRAPTLTGILFFYSCLWTWTLFVPMHALGTETMFLNFAELHGILPPIKRCLYLAYTVVSSLHSPLIKQDRLI